MLKLQPPWKRPLPLSKQTPVKIKFLWSQPPPPPPSPPPILKIWQEAQPYSRKSGMSTVWQSLTLRANIQTQIIWSFTGVSTVLSPTESLLSNEFLRDLPHGQSFEWLPVKAGVTKKIHPWFTFFLIYIIFLTMKYR